MTAPRKRWVIDEVALAGALAALLGCLGLAFAVRRASRIAPVTEPHMLLEFQPAGWVALALAVAALAVAFVPRAETRRVAARCDAAALAVALSFALGAAAQRLTDTPIARVSASAGFWVSMAGTAVLAFAGEGARIAPARSRALSLALAAAVAAGVVAAARFGGLAELSIAKEYASRSVVFWSLALQHLALAGAGLAGGILIGVPLGVLAARERHVRDVALTVTGILETVPSLALLGLLIAPLAAIAAAYPALGALGFGGIGPAPAVIALVMYALLPIVRGTYVALTSVDPSVVDAARGMGMGAGRIFRRIEVPLALPLVIEGIRVAIVLLVGITTVTAFVGEGGFGALIFQGIGQNAPDLILLGALPTIVLAVLADYALRGLAFGATPRGVRPA